MNGGDEVRAPRKEEGTASRGGKAAAGESHGGSCRKNCSRTGRTHPQNCSRTGSEQRTGRKVRRQGSEQTTCREQRTGSERNTCRTGSERTTSPTPDRTKDATVNTLTHTRGRMQNTRLLTPRPTQTVRVGSPIRPTPTPKGRKSASPDSLARL